MRNPRIVTSAWAVAAGLLAFGPASRGAEPKLHAITIGTLTFGQSLETLHVNDIVEWTNADILRHTATATDKSFDIDLPAGTRGRTVLKRAGVITYICRFHPGMKGQLDVAP